MLVRRSWTLTAPLALALAMSSGCSKDGEDGGDGAGSADATGGDVDEGGETGGDGGGIAWDAGPVYGVANRDDDDQNGKFDWADLPFDGDDDTSSLVLSEELLADLEATGDDVRLRLAGDVDGVRLWQDPTGAPILGANSGEPAVTEITVAGASLPDLIIEFGTYNTKSVLTMERLDGGDVVDTVDVTLPGAPLILHHHVQPAEDFWVISVNFGGGANNAAMIMDYESQLGDAFTAVPGNVYGGDVWIQDEIELATQVGNAGQRQDVFIDSIRDRGLDNFPEDTQGSIFAVDTWGTPGTENSCDSFGNLEVTPPVTVDGVEYPFGRVYYGDGGPGCRVSEGLRTFLAAQEVQAPYEADTSWLCVGHVDEFATFIPDPGSEKGFKFLFANTDEAWTILEGMDPTMALPRYQDTHGFATVGAILADQELRTRNDDVQANRLDPILEEYKAEFGLVDEDIILIPSLFERCGGNSYNVALIPGTPNLVVANPGEGPLSLIIPDTFMRPDGAPPSEDPFITDFIERMPAAYAPEDIIPTDDWYVYHANLGEVHCGTNFTRTPDPKPWWDVATHLMN